MHGLAGIWKRLWLALLLMLPLGLAHGSDLEQRLERMEAQLEQLLKQLERQSADVPAAPTETTPAPAAEQPATPAPEADPAPIVTPAPAPAPASRAGSTFAATHGEVQISYFMDSMPMGTTPPTTAPMARGLHLLERDLRMDPYHYGAAERRILTGYRDPSEYRAVGILMEGLLEVPQSGAHHFEIAPKPAREGGESRASNEMTIYLWMDGEPVIELEGLRGWRHQVIERNLSAGQHPFRLWVVSNSPGYGAPPIDSRLGMTISMPGRAQQMPLWRLMTPPE